jgi:hypothetical protein
MFTFGGWPADSNLTRCTSRPSRLVEHPLGAPEMPYGTPFMAPGSASSPTGVLAMAN